MSFPLRSRSVAALVRAIEDGYTKSTTTTLLLEAELDPWDVGGANKQERLHNLFHALRAETEVDVNGPVFNLVCLVLTHGQPHSEWEDPAPWYLAVVDAIRADGWDWEDGKLTPVVPGVGTGQEVSWIERDLRRRGWTTASGHYTQAVDAFGSANWASANAQLRAFLEELLPRSAELVDGRRPRHLQPSLDALEKHGVLVEGEKGLLKHLGTLLNPRGPHAGLSDEDEARFRILTVTACARFLLARLH